MLQKLMSSYSKNSVNGYSDDVSMIALEKQNTDMLDGIHLFRCAFKLYNLNYFLFLVDCDLLTEDNNLVTNPEDMCVVAIGSGSGDQSEDSSITDSER